MKELEPSAAQVEGKRRGEADFTSSLGGQKETHLAQLLEAHEKLLLPPPITASEVVLLTIENENRKRMGC